MRACYGSTEGRFDNQVHEYAAFVYHAMCACVCLEDYLKWNNTSLWSWYCWNIFYFLQSLTFSIRHCEIDYLEVPRVCLTMHTCVCHKSSITREKRNFRVFETILLERYSASKKNSNKKIDLHRWNLIFPAMKTTILIKQNIWAPSTSGCMRQIT